MSQSGGDPQKVNNVDPRTGAVKKTKIIESKSKVQVKPKVKDTQIKDVSAQSQTSTASGRSIIIVCFFEYVTIDFVRVEDIWPCDI